MGRDVPPGLGSGMAARGGSAGAGVIGPAFIGSKICPPFCPSEDLLGASALAHTSTASTGGQTRGAVTRRRCDVSAAATGTSRTSTGSAGSAGRGGGWFGFAGGAVRGRTAVAAATSAFAAAGGGGRMVHDDDDYYDDDVLGRTVSDTFEHKMCWFNRL